MNVEWSKLSSQEVWDSLRSAPRVAGPWEPGETGEMDVRRAIDRTIVATTLWVAPAVPSAHWRVPVPTSDRDGADKILREHGWRLATGQTA